MKRNKFSLSNYKLLSCDMGQLVPIGLTEVLPGDAIQQSTNCLVRCSPLLAPVMHPVHARVTHWFVPHRLVWEDWEDFITGGPDGMNASVFPFLASSGLTVGTLKDYLGYGLSTGVVNVSALPLRGYALIWNEWYRDEDLETLLTIDLTSGQDTTTNTALQNCAWEKDYFTSSRPWEQKGPAITIPIGTTAPITGLAFLESKDPTDGNPAAAKQTGGVAATGWTAHTGLEAASAWVGRLNQTGVGASPEVYANLASASAVTVNILREAMALQRFEEARARYGSRYVEYLRYLGVKSSDARLQRPEYLGGGQQTIQFSEVLQTAEGTDPVGELRGHGIGALRSNRYRRFFEEHGYIFTMLSVKPKTVYNNPMPRTLNRTVKEDFWQKELEHIGQQEVLNKEVSANHATPNGVFGYQDRYDEYRRSESTTAGEFRTTLDFWHFARDFASDPALNATFVKCVPSEEPFAVPSANTLYVMARHSIQARRLVAGSGSSFIF